MGAAGLSRSSPGNRRAPRGMSSARTARPGRGDFARARIEVPAVARWPGFRGAGARDGSSGRVCASTRHGRRGARSRDDRGSASPRSTRPPMTGPRIDSPATPYASPSARAAGRCSRSCRRLVSFRAGSPRDRRRAAHQPPEVCRRRRTGVDEGVCGRPGSRRAPRGPRRGGFARRSGPGAALCERSGALGRDRAARARLLAAVAPRPSRRRVGHPRLPVRGGLRGRWSASNPLAIRPRLMRARSPEPPGRPPT
jgi:hypothetical protein